MPGFAVAGIVAVDAFSPMPAVPLAQAKDPPAWAGDLTAVS